MVGTRQGAGTQDAELVLELLEQDKRSPHASARRVDWVTDHHNANVGQIAPADKERADPASGNLPSDTVAGRLPTTL